MSDGIVFYLATLIALVVLAVSDRPWWAIIPALVIIFGKWEIK